MGYKGEVRPLPHYYVTSMNAVNPDGLKHISGTPGDLVWDISTSAEWQHTTKNKPTEAADHGHKIGTYWKVQSLSDANLNIKQLTDLQATLDPMVEQMEEGDREALKSSIQEMITPKMVSVTPGGSLPEPWELNEKCPVCDSTRPGIWTAGEKCTHDFHQFFGHSRKYETIPLTCILCKKSVTNDQTKLKKCPECKECCDSCDDSKPWWTGDLLGHPVYHNVTRFEARREALRLMHSNPEGWEYKKNVSRKYKSEHWYGKKLTNYMSAVIMKGDGDCKWQISVNILLKTGDEKDSWYVFQLATSNDEDMIGGEYKPSFKMDKICMINFCEICRRSRRHGRKKRSNCRTCRKEVSPLKVEKVLSCC